jgi:peptide/nickel transport system ATP-binding protein
VARAHRLAASAAEAREMAAGALAEVGLDDDLAERYPHQLSGGQRQRVLLARALVLRPAFVVFDEPTSALDLSVQAQVLEVIADLRDRFGLTAAFISHDLRVVRAMADRIAVMYLGEVVEMGQADAVTSRPRHPYAQALLGAVLSLDPDAVPPVPLAGDPPDPAAAAPGCRFHPRCPRAADPCTGARPHRQTLPDGREVACHAVVADLSGRPWPGDERASAA